MSSFLEVFAGVAATVVVAVVPWALFVERRLSSLEARFQNGIASDVVDHETRLREIERRNSAGD